MSFTGTTFFGKGRHGSKMPCHLMRMYSAFIFILFLVLSNFLSGCKNANAGFYKQVLNDFDSSSYFIALDIKSPYYRGRVIIENDNLYRFLNKTRGFDKEKYKSFMEKILSHHRKLKVNERDFGSWNFIRVYQVENVVLAANMGRDSFVAYYFNGTVLKYGIGDEEKNAIINQLFYWGIPARYDVLTGDLMIG